MTSLLRTHFGLSLLLFLCYFSFGTAFRLTKKYKHDNFGLTRCENLRNECRPRKIAEEMVVSSTALHVARRFKNFDQVLDTFREEPMMIYFSTEKCGPCHLMKKELILVREMMGEEFQKLKMFSVDTEKWPEVGSRFEVSRLPCLVIFREGQVKLRMEGVNRAELVVEQVRSFL